MSISTLARGRRGLAAGTHSLLRLRQSPGRMAPAKDLSVRVTTTARRTLPRRPDATRTFYMHHGTGAAAFMIHGRTVPVHQLVGRTYTIPPGQNLWGMRTKQYEPRSLKDKIGDLCAKGVANSYAVCAASNNRPDAPVSATSTRLTLEVYAPPSTTGTRVTCVPEGVTVRVVAAHPIGPVEALASMALAPDVLCMAAGTGTIAAASTLAEKIITTITLI